MNSAIHQDRPVLITGGAGFIGTNLAHRLLSEGRRVRIYDSLARPGVEQNAAWLRQTHGNLVDVETASMTNVTALRRSVRDACQVFHFAAQVAVTTSVVDPLLDFETNVAGTVNLLEEMRRLPSAPPLVYTSTNKVYGNLEDVRLRSARSRYEPVDMLTRSYGIGEWRRLDFHTPYGCSKGAAEQYVLDYARTYSQPGTVFRMSCIYGPHQFGTEDQGWVAHFLIRALEGRPITLYGDGKQVRDILYVEDLVDAFLLAQSHMGTVSGQAFNIGGGPPRTVSLLELLDLIGELTGDRPAISFQPWRTGDQRYYTSDTTKFQNLTGWAPRVSVRSGLEKLYQWLCTERHSAPEPVVAGKGV